MYFVAMITRMTCNDEGNLIDASSLKSLATINLAELIQCKATEVLEAQDGVVKCRQPH